MTGRRWLHACVLIVALGACATTAGAREVLKVYRARHRPVAELATIARGVMGSSGSVVVDERTATLILTGSSRAVARTLALLDQQDRRLANIVLTYESRRLGELQSQGIAVDWTAAGGRLRVGRPMGADGIRARLEGSAQRTTESAQGRVRVLEGEEGVVELGRAVPLRVPGTGTTEMVSASRGLVARPLVLGDGRIRVELWVFEGKLVRGGIEEADVATVVMVEPGEAVVVGGIGQVGQSQQATLPSAVGQGANAEEWVVLLSAHVEGPDSP